MPDYVGLVIALAVGLPLLGVALWVDVRRRRRVESELAAPPQRDLPAVDRHLPTYVTQAEVDALPRPDAGTTVGDVAPSGTRIGFGHADGDFATAGGRADVTDAVVLMVDGDVTTMRELLRPVASATAERPLVIVATGFDADVLATLKANRRALTYPVVAAIARTSDLETLTDVVGGEALKPADLQAGYVPDHALGRAARWVSDASSTWVTPVGP